jgi:PEP-CTERM motif
MKKSIVLAILGVATAAGMTSSYGQGSVVFKNYFSSSSPTINFGASAGANAGMALGSSFEAQLLWFNGLTSDASSLTAVGSPVIFGTSVTGASPVADGDLAHGAGYFIGPTVSLTGYSSGLATFEVMVTGTENGVTYSGVSSLFTMTPATGASPPPGFNQVQSGTGAIQYDGSTYNVEAVPEPTTMALGGLGMAAMMFFRRKRA